MRELKSLVKKIDRYPLPISMGHKFEAPASAVLHENLKIPSTFAGARDFWLWLTFAAKEGGFVELIDWRFGSGTIADVNYGIGTMSTIREGLFARLWWRGEVGRNTDETGMPYSVARKGSVDLWRSHFIRPEIGRCRRVVEAFLRAKHPQDDSDGVQLTVDEERELSKRLTMLNATIAFEVLDSAEIDRIIAEAVQEIRNDKFG
ncbi:MAG: hypothetical protein OXI87_21375 [Albidovulum sp.]|nr:hypothetical protein [Albidovulum sp.]